MIKQTGIRIKEIDMGAKSRPGKVCHQPNEAVIVVTNYTVELREDYRERESAEEAKRSKIGKRSLGCPQSLTRRKVVPAERACETSLPSGAPAKLLLRARALLLAAAGLVA